MTEEHVTDQQVLAFVRKHPHATARMVAAHFYTVKAQLACGARLKRLVRAGQLTETYNHRWSYVVREDARV